MINSIKLQDSCLWQVQRRIVGAHLQHLQAAPQRLRQSKPRARSKRVLEVDRLLSATAHQVGFSKSGTASCSACKTMALPKVLKAWLKGPCCRQFSWRGGVQQPEAEVVRVGSAVVHPPTHPSSTRGCGCAASAVPTAQSQLGASVEPSYWCSPAEASSKEEAGPSGAASAEACPPSQA